MHPFAHEQLRVLNDLSSLYRAWSEQERAWRSFGGRLTWKTISAKDYLYVITDGKGNGRSLGPASAATHAQFDRYQRAREAAEAIQKDLAMVATVYRALRLPLISAQAAEVLRALDLQQALGRDFLVIGTTAFAAYQLECGAAFPGTFETRDFDLSWCGAVEHETAILLPVLKSIDPLYTVNQERTFQARNSKAFEVELLVGTEVKQRKAVKHESPLIALEQPEQNWLLRGQHIDQIVCGSDGKATRVVVPDPRWFALHKLWLSKKPGREPSKIPKDAHQARLLWRALHANLLPRYPLDSAFKKSLPDTLRPILAELEASLTGLT